MQREPAFESRCDVASEHARGRASPPRKRRSAGLGFPLRCPSARRHLVLAAVALGVGSTPLALAADSGVPSGARSQPSAPGDALRVVAAGGVPFVLDDTGEGLSVAVWRAVAQRLRVDYEISRAPSVEEALRLVLEGRADIAVGPISITAERAGRLQFTQPYLHAGLAILSKPTLEPSQLLSPFLSSTFIGGAAILFCLLTLIGALVWLAERRANPDQFPPAPKAGIANGAWFALVTMTTVGYGDRVPTTPLGRMIAAVWMLIAVISLSSLTAGIASSLTLVGFEAGSIESAEQLRGVRVACVRGSTGADFARDHGARLLELPNLEAAVDGLLQGEAKAVVYDQPMLEYYLSQHPEQRLRISPQSYRPTGYGFATRPGSSLSPRVNESLLALLEQGRIDTAVERWLGAR